MPGNATPKLKRFASRLLDSEAAQVTAAGANAVVAFRVCEKLLQRLAELVGVAGVKALFSRALVLGREDVRWLGDLHITPDGSLEGLNRLEADQNEIARGEVVLVAEILGLLVTFIGPGLTLRLIQADWPNAAFDDSSFE